MIESGQNLAFAFYNRGIAYSDKGQYDRAIQDFDQAVQLNPRAITEMCDSDRAFENVGALFRTDSHI
jgi:tetratricopeptide (TPR) repeat protein